MVIPVSKGREVLQDRRAKEQLTVCWFEIKMDDGQYAVAGRLHLRAGSGH